MLTQEPHAVDGRLQQLFARETPPTPGREVVVADRVEDLAHHPDLPALEPHVLSVVVPRPVPVQTCEEAAVLLVNRVVQPEGQDLLVELCSEPVDRCSRNGKWLALSHSLGRERRKE